MNRALEATVAVGRLIAVAVGVGALLGALTKAVLVLFRAAIAVLWEWLPDRLGADPSSVVYMAVVLGVGGLLVGVGQRYLGSYPEPLETVLDNVRHGAGIDHRTIPKTMANSLAALGFGGPLGPETALVSVIGGVFYWTRRHMDALAQSAYRTLRG